MAEKDINKGSSKSGSKNKSDGSGKAGNGRPTNSMNPLRPNGKNPKMNTYWIIGIILLALVGMQFLNNPGGMVEIDSNEFFEMLRDGDVEKIVIVNKEKVEIYIKPERLEDPKHNEVRDSRTNTMLGQNLPQYYFTIVFPDVF